MDERQENALEEGGWFEDGLFECQKVMEIQTLVASNVVANSRQQNQVEKSDRFGNQHAAMNVLMQNELIKRIEKRKYCLPLCKFGIHVGGEQNGGSRPDQHKTHKLIK